MRGVQRDGERRVHVSARHSRQPTSAASSGDGGVTAPPGRTEVRGG